MRISKKTQRENAKKWLDALRSGKYKQGIGRLNYRNNFCCLGVMCEIFHEEYKIKREQYEFQSCSYDGDFSIPSNRSFKILGLKTSGANILMDLNDVKTLTFQQIAEHIEEHWNEIFEHTKE